MLWKPATESICSNVGVAYQNLLPLFVMGLCELAGLLGQELEHRATKRWHDDLGYWMVEKGKTIAKWTGWKINWDWAEGWP